MNNFSSIFNLYLLTFDLHLNTGQVRLCFNTVIQTSFGLLNTTALYVQLLWQKANNAQQYNYGPWSASSSTRRFRIDSGSSSLATAKSLSLWYHLADKTVEKQANEHVCSKLVHREFVVNSLCNPV